MPFVNLEQMCVFMDSARSYLSLFRPWDTIRSRRSISLFQVCPYQMDLMIVYLWGAIVYFTVAWFSDRLQKRGIFLATTTLVTIVGYIVLLAIAKAQKPGVLYFATYLVATGLYVGPGLNITYSLPIVN